MSDSFIPKIDFKSQDIPRYLLSIAVIFFLWNYINEFLTLSNDMVDSISVSVLVNGNQLNDGYFSLSGSLTVIGPIFFLLYILASNEFSNIFSNPKGWNNYSNTVIGISGIIFLFLVANVLEFRPKNQIWIILGAAVLSGVILVLNDTRGMLESILKSIRDPKNTIQIWRNGSIEAFLTLAIILFYIIVMLVPVLLPAFSANFYFFLENPILIFSIMILSVSLYSLWDLSRERHKPTTQDQIFSSTVLLISIPFILYLILRIMVLIKTDENWILSYDFMEEVGGFPVTNWPWQIDASNDNRWTFYRAGVINSARATLVSIVLCTLLGIFIGVTRLSNNRLASGLATAYVEFFRNIPLAILLFFVAVQFREIMPDFSEEVFIFNSFYLSKEGHWIPAPQLTNILIAISILIGTKFLTSYLDRDGVDDSDEGVIRRLSIWALSVAVSIAVFLSGGLSLPELIQPDLENSAGWYIVDGTGFKITETFVALVTALTLFTASIVAEIVRGSIQSLPRGQVEAAISLGLNPFQRLRLVILPQALRSMVPLLNSQYMNVWKNSSLAIIVGFSDIFLIILILMNNAGKLIPLFMLLLVTYQAGSLLISAIMNAYNARVTKVKI